MHCSTVNPAGVRVDFEPSEYSVGEGDDSVTLRVVRRRDADIPVTVLFSTQDGTAQGTPSIS